MLTVDAHELERVQFVPHVTCLEIRDGLCYIEGDDLYDVDAFPVSDLIAVVEEDY